MGTVRERDLPRIRAQMAEETGVAISALTLLKAQNLADLPAPGTARNNLGLGTLATQSGTFSGTHSGASSGTNTGDQVNITGNAATVTTNANLTGPITSAGNATAVASQTGTGTKFVMDSGPTLVAPLLGTPASGVLANCTGLPIGGGGTGQSTKTAAMDALSPTSAKGDLLVDNGTNVIVTAVGADGTVLQALASATPGLRWAGAPLALSFMRNGINANVTAPMYLAGGTDAQFIVPVGWILAIVALSGYSLLTTANTGTLKLHVDDVDQSGSFGSMVVPASTANASISAEPSAPPFVVDATSARKRVNFKLVTSNSGGGAASFTANLMGYLYKP